MGVVILGDLFQFPEGSAATNRVYTYAKGLQEQGVKVYVICFGNDYVPQVEGVMEGINYFYPFRQKKRNRYFVVRRWQTVRKYVNCFLLLRKISREQKIDAIISYSNFVLTHAFASLLAKRSGTKLLIECNEHPLRNFQHGYLNRKRGLVKNFIEAYVADGVICISQYLVDFFKLHGVPPEKLFLVPSTVDPTRFAVVGTDPMPEKYVGYFGSLTFGRDSLDTLIKAFAQAKQFHTGLRLVLGGFCTAEQKVQLTNLIQTLGLTDDVYLLEYLSRNEITRYITHAIMLVMVRNKDLQSDASYPSKLSEFLATGKPVIAVKVGDVPLYLMDKVNAYLTEPGDVNGLAEKISYVLDHHVEAEAVGRAGYTLANTTFHYSYQAKRLLGFIHSLHGQTEAGGTVPATN